jgi:hypothetical protein
MRGIAGYNETEATNYAGGELPKLEPGGYVLMISNVKVEETQWGVRLALMFDICEGEQRGFFKKLYDATPSDWENKKWKGSYRIKIPQNDGDNERYRKSVGFFKSQIEAFEKSNNGLHINAAGDWDEQILRGKIVGAVFNEKEWAMNGKTGFFTQCKHLISAADIRSGNFQIPKPDHLKTNNNTAQNGGFSSYVTAELATPAPAVNNDFEFFGSDYGVPF